MRRFALTMLLSAGLASVALANVAEARRAFEREQGRPFRHAELLSREAAAADRFDKVSGKAEFRFAMPYADDARLKFVSAEFENGKFVSGRLHVLGFEPQAIDGETFEKLRDSQPMVAVRAESDEAVPRAVLFPARKTERAITVADVRSLSLNPVVRVLGPLNASLPRLGVSTDRLSYLVSLVGKDGLGVELGVAKLKSPIAEATLFDKVRKALETANPARRGQVSDRDVVDWVRGATVSCRGN